MAHKLLILISGIFILSACTQLGGYTYNEKVAKLYFTVSDPYEDVYKHLLDRNRTISDVELMKETEGLKLAIGKAILGYNSLIPIADAKMFHDKVGQYFRVVEEDFVRELQTYVNLDTKSVSKRDSIIENIKNLYSDISSIEDEILDEQLKFARKIGVKTDR